jgi:hypothetical protein
MADGAAADNEADDEIVSIAGDSRGISTERSQQYFFQGNMKQILASAVL